VSEAPAVQARAAPETDGEEAPAPAPAKRSKRKLVIAAVALAVVVGGGASGAYFMLGGDGGEGAHAAEADQEASDEPPAFVEVPPMVVNLRTPDGQARFLKLRFVLVPKEAGGEEALKAKLPLILDAYQPFLRELRPEDLAGSAAVFRLKEEMLVRATSIMGPGSVRDVLIQDMIQQ